jgi:putative hemolysin
VGEIEDEYDLPDARLERGEDGTVRASGAISIDDLNETLGLALPQRGQRTLAGLVFATLGRRPAVGDRVEVEGVRLAVDEIQGLRITRLTLTLPPPARPVVVR